jgi:SAM-dependent methyltransferase
MPGSMEEGKAFTKQFLLDKNIKRVLDVGPGSGNYFDLLAHDINAEWVGIEICDFYIPRFDLLRRYNKVVIADIYNADWNDLGEFDVIILGDVIEHMLIDRAQKVIKECIEHAKWVVISLPIIDYPQGASWGNKYEEHVEQYNPQRVRKLIDPYNLIAAQEGEVIGVYIISKG